MINKTEPNRRVPVVGTRIGDCAMSKTILVTGPDLDPSATTLVAEHGMRPSTRRPTPTAT